MLTQSVKDQPCPNRRRNNDLASMKKSASVQMIRQTRDSKTLAKKIVTA
jgi:hypothetical protein